MIASGQVAAFTPTEIGELSGTQISELTPRQVSAFNRTQIAAFRPDQISFSPGQLSVLSAAQVSAFDPAALAAFAATQIRSLTAVDIAGLTSAQLSALSPGQVSAMTATQVRGFTVSELQALSPDQFQALTETRNIDVGLDYQAEASVWLMIDDVRIRQVLYNLVGNACKFTQSGSVNLSVGIGQKKGAAHLRVEVRDSGPGLSPEQQEKLFTRFNQVDNSINRKYGGSGLGLSICYEIVRLMQGEIGVVSALGEGSCFWFEIPVTQVGAPQPVKPGENLKPVFLEDRKVLIVDDHPINRELIRLLLKDYGLDIFEACDGEEAVEMCLKTKFDLVFMDIQMPVLDGITATHRIREQGGRNVPDAIVALSAATQTKLSDDTKGHGFTHVLCKPIDLPQFYATLYRCLEGDAHPARLTG